MASIWQNPYASGGSDGYQGRGTFINPYVSGAQTGTTPVDRTNPPARTPTTSPPVTTPPGETTFDYDIINGHQVPKGFNPYTGGNGPIIMPGGRAWGTWSAQEQADYLNWLFGPPTGGSPNPTTTSGGGSSGSSGGSSGIDWSTFAQIFDDPSGAMYEAAVRQRLGQLNTPITMSSIPGMQEFYNTVTARMTDLQNPLQYTPEEQTLMAALAGRAASLSTPYNNPELERAISQGTQYANKLRQAPFTALEEKGQEVKAYDQLERDRTEAKRQVMERLAARGVGAGSGIVEKALQDVDNRFDALRAQNTNALLMYRTDVGAQREAQAFNVDTQVATMRDTALQRADERADQVIELLGDRATLSQQLQIRNEIRAQEMVSLSQSLAAMGIDLFGMNEDRARETVTTASLLPELAYNRYALMNSADGSALPAFSNSSMGILNFGAGQRNSLQNNQFNWGTAAAALAPLFYPQSRR